jgi:hypothetical protein
MLGVFLDLLGRFCNSWWIEDSAVINSINVRTFLVELR